MYLSKILARMSVCTLGMSLIVAPTAFAADVKPSQQPVFQASKQQEIQAVRPNRPPKVKLHRTAKGEHMWDITPWTAPARMSGWTAG
ncbi:MAG TPA: hypothetical protein VK445_05115 [Dissulfurispiraceae bacterium]|nr:hypothetical protein [Dissulfurispiraceae bacterium]